MIKTFKGEDIINEEFDFISVIKTSVKESHPDPNILTYIDVQYYIIYIDPLGMGVKLSDIISILVNDVDVHNMETQIGNYIVLRTKVEEFSSITINYIDKMEERGKKLDQIL